MNMKVLQFSLKQIHPQIFLHLNDVIKFINTKTKKKFKFFTKNHNTRVFALLLICKRIMRTEVSLHVS